MAIKHNKIKRIIISLLVVSIIILLNSCGAIIIPVDNNESVVSETVSEVSTCVLEPEISIPDISETSEPSGFEAEISSEFAIVYDETNNKILFEKDSDIRCYPASLTKLITAIVAVENFGLDEVFTVGNELSLVQTGSSIAFLQSGQKLSLKMLLEALLIPSGNDAAYVIASGVIRKLENENDMYHRDAVAKFCEMMNKKAVEIGAVNTHFVNPDGWHDDNHYTTARDILLISKYAHSIPVIVEITSTVRIDETFLTGEVVTWVNSNKLLKETADTSKNYYNEYVKGLKTGFTDEAGNCLSAYGEYEDKKIYVVILNAPTDEARYMDVNLLFEKAFTILN
ncbi:MAG: hypothetical protein A2Y17_05760 [Clostridiales bacterium GWF2_38_85]|nr:MAG: hypothetical protein A2Y17_05760 [Clostridiales bacterium GWF2_38_85]HBL84012.1 hypothetical protein [Clostridiales bacterium]